MNTIKLKDSELYDLLIEASEELGYNQYMPEPGCLFESADGNKSMTVWATSFKTVEPIKEGEDIKAYIQECIKITTKKHNKCDFYPYSIRKSDNGTRLILRGAFQVTGWMTNMQDGDKELNKSILDKVEANV